VPELWIMVHTCQCMSSNMVITDAWVVFDTRGCSGHVSLMVLMHREVYIDDMLLNSAQLAQVPRRMSTPT
jgi:hypothetical protein